MTQQVLVTRRATHEEMQLLATSDGCHYYWLDEMDSLIGNTFTAKRPRELSIVVDTFRIPRCVTETVVQ